MKFNSLSIARATGLRKQLQSNAKMTQSYDVTIQNIIEVSVMLQFNLMHNIMTTVCVFLNVYNLYF